MTRKRTLLDWGPGCLSPQETSRPGSELQQIGQLPAWLGSSLPSTPKSPLGNPSAHWLFSHTSLSGSWQSPHFSAGMVERHLLMNS